MENQDQVRLQAPSNRALVQATSIALLVALLLLFTVILPAEYGFDPFKTGAALGLTGMAQSSEPTNGGKAPAAPIPAGIYTSQTKIFKVASEDFVLRPGDGMEMKYHMEKGAGMVYGWKADGILEYEFHGEPDVKPNKGYFESYELDKTGKASSYGSFTAPSTGIHGWFWRNNGKKDVQFHLNVSGFFDSSKMMSGGDSEDMPVEDAK
jgi:hypothetical protein